MAFKFSLATVLRVRGIVEEREERMLQQIQQQISNTIQAVAQTDNEIAHSNGSRVASVFKTSIGTNIQASYGELAQLKLNRTELESQLDKLKQLREIQIKAYNTARRNREMLTEMHAEKREVYNADVAGREQSALDDNFIARRGRV